MAAQKCGARSAIGDRDQPRLIHCDSISHVRLNDEESRFDFEEGWSDSRHSGSDAACSQLIEKAAVCIQNPAPNESHGVRIG